MNKTIEKIGVAPLLVFSIPSIITGWGFVIIAIITFLAHKPKIIPKSVLVAQWRPWVEKIWRYSTTFGRGIIYQTRVADKTPREIDNKVEKHEMVHIRQLEDMNFLAFLVALVVTIVTENWILGLGLWLSSPLWLLFNYVTAFLRGGHIYRDSEHERAAYAQCDVYNNSSWLDRHLEKPRDW